MPFIDSRFVKKRRPVGLTLTGQSASGAPSKPKVERHGGVAMLAGSLSLLQPSLEPARGVFSSQISKLRDRHGFYAPEPQRLDAAIHSDRSLARVNRKGW